MAQRDAKKAYQSRMQQQERLAIRYLKIGQSSQCPYYKGIKIIFQNYGKYLPEMECTLRDEASAERYLNDPCKTAPEELLTEIYIPVE